MTRLKVATPVGEAAVDLDLAPGARTLLVIGHGAGGSVEAPDLQAVRNACLAAGISVARVTQPYRLAGKKAPPTAATLDTAWRAVIASLGRRKATAGLRLVYAGPSSGARVACRAACEQAIKPRPVAIVALAFPLHPPGNSAKSRLAELAAVQLPVLVVQGLGDPFGMPEAGPGRTVEKVAGDHSLKGSAGRVGELVAGWISALA